MNIQADRRQRDLAVICWVLGIVSFAPPVVAIASELRNPSTGMFRHLGLALGILAGLALNVFSFAANLLYARRTEWTVRWLTVVLHVQGIGVAVLLCAALMVMAQ